jgi:mannose-6-phosphate isomerase-like protein (cupin superfamily)
MATDDTDETDDLGDVATRVLHDNDRVRIWELVLEPGERSARHRHDLDYLLVFLEGDRIGVEVDPASAGPYRDNLEFDVPIGQCVYVPRGGVETAVNVGSGRYRELLIELKDPVP